MDRLSSVRGLRRDMIASLAELSSLLGTARQHLLAVTDHTRTLVALQDEPVAGIAHIPDLANGLAQALHCWSASIESGPTRVHLRDTRVRLNGLTRIRMFFQFLSTITSIQISRSRSGQLTAFVDALRAVSAQIETELAQLQDSLDDVGKGLDTILAVAREGAAHLEPAARQLTEILAPIVAAEAQMAERRRGVTTQAQDLSRRIEEVIGRLIGTFQFSDSAAQRLEHIETILETAMAQAPGPRREAFQLLAAAQLRALGADATEVLTILEGSFHSIEGLGGGFISELAAQRTEVAQLLAAQDRAFAQLKGMLDTVMPTLRGIIVRSAGFEGQIAQLHARLDKLAGIGQTIGLAGVNSHLEAARAEVGQKELTYIAMSVKETAQLALQTFAETSRCLDGLRTSFETSEFSALQTGMTALESDLDGIAASLDQARERQSRVTRLEDQIRSETAALAQVAASGRQMTSGLSRTITAIAALDSRLGEAGPAGADLHALDQIEPIYTMDREREVHADLVGRPMDRSNMEAARLHAAAPQESLDSILF